MAQGVKESLKQRYRSGKRKEVKTKHSSKEGPTGFGNLEKTQR